MFPYFLVFSLTLIFFSVGNQTANNKQLGGRLFIAVALILLISFAAYRSSWVGTDTRTYLALWNDIQNSNFNDGWLYSEPLFYWLQIVTRYIADNTFLGKEVFLGAISALVCILTFSAINQVSKNKVLSLFVFLFLGFYTFHFNGARQAIAMALFIYSIKYILTGNAKKYALIVFVGFLFHKTMLITVPFYFLFRLKFTPKIVALIVISTIVASFSITNIVDYASEFDVRYKSYASSDFTGGIIQVLFFTFILIWLYIAKKVNRINEKLYDISLVSMLLSVCIGWMSVALSLNPSGILRLTGYFAQFMIFCLPISVLAFPRSNFRSLVLLAFVSLSILYFYLTTSNFSGLAPYSLDVDLLF